MPVKFFKKLAVLFLVVGVLLSGIIVVGTNIVATDLGPGDVPIRRLSNDKPRYPIEVHYMHSNPSPPTGDTNSQADLPFTTTVPTATILYNYDQDVDAEPGKQIAKGGSGANESDLNKYQNWRTGVLSSNLVFDGVVNFHFWSGIKDFGDGKAGEVKAFLRDYNGTGYTEITNVTLFVSDWQGGSSTWVEKTLAFPSVVYSVPAGNQLEVKYIVGGNAGDDMWFAYDTTALDSRLVFP